MLTNPQIINDSKNILIQPTIGVYPVTSLGVSFFYHANVDLLMCRQNGVTSKLFAKEPILNIKIGSESSQVDISNKFSNGMLVALKGKALPEVIICTPPYEFLDDFINEIKNIALELNNLEYLKPYNNLNKFYFPNIILASNGIILDSAISKLRNDLLENNFNEKICDNICNKIVRGVVMQASHRENNVYYPQKPGIIKIAIHKHDLFSQIFEMLSSKKFTFSINTNPAKLEFEKAIINIATNSAAIALSVDESNNTFNMLNLEQCINNQDKEIFDFIYNLQKSVFKIGKRQNAFSVSETFERIWIPRKEQVLKHDSQHISSSLHCLKYMAKTNSIPEGMLNSEKSIIYPLKKLATQFELDEELKLLNELEDKITKNLDFLRTNSNNINWD